MLISVRRAIWLCSIQIACLGIHDCYAGDLTIINLADHPVVVGIYTPGDAKCDQTLICIDSSTELTGIPLEATENERFAIAYDAKIIEGKIVRSKPYTVCGMGNVNVYSESGNTTAPRSIVFYNNPTIPQGDASKHIWSPKTEKAAISAHKDAENHARLTRTTLKKQPFERAMGVSAEPSHEPKSP